MSVLSTSGPARRRILTPYVMIWMAIASFALAYLALLGLRPHMFAGAARNTADIEQKLAQTKRDVQRGLADIEPLARTVGEVKMDVANLKIAVQDAANRDQDLTQRVSALETAAPPSAPEPPHAASAPGHPAAAIPPTPTPKPGKTTAAKTFRPPVGPTAQEVHAPAPQKSAKLINAAPKDTDSIETGSIKRTVTTVPPAVNAKTATKPLPVGVILARGPSIDSLRLNWSILTDRHADAMRNLHPRYVVNGKASKRTYGLVVGPVASTAEAKSLCNVMESRGLPCEVSTYRGNAL